MPIQSTPILSISVLVNRLVKSILLFILICHSTLIYGTDDNQVMEDKYYYRYQIFQEGYHGNIICLHILDADSVSRHISMLEYVLIGDLNSDMWIQNLSGPAWLPRPRTEGVVTSNLLDWEYFEKFSDAVYRLPMDRGVIRGDSIYIKGALLRDPDELERLGLTGMTNTWFDFEGKIEGELIKGLLTVQDAVFLLDDDGTRLDSLFRCDSVMAVFQKK